MRGHYLDGQPAGLLAVEMPAHAIRHDEETIRLCASVDEAYPLQRKDIVLVRVSRALDAWMRQAGGLRHQCASLARAARLLRRHRQLEGWLLIHQNRAAVVAGAVVAHVAYVAAVVVTPHAGPWYRRLLVTHHLPVVIQFFQRHIGRPQIE